MSSGELSEEDRRLLLRVAREALVAHFEGRDYQPPPGSPAVREARAAFVSLHRRADDDLRGCVGVMESEEPLAENVARMAVAAATHDGRFAAVTRDELPGLVLEISVLGPMRAVRPEEVEVGRDGLLVSYAGRRGVLLPQVPVEHGWDRETFLAKTCGKAGLPRDTWRQPEVKLLAFVADVFGEEDGEASGDPRL
ncbi:MAG TPA: AmmeMemoRadiSam system protein A [Vicinamibacteria bacterium]